MAADGLTTLRSSYGPHDTMNRLEAEVKAHGMTVFARIDHAAGAAGAGLSLQPTAEVKAHGMTVFARIDHAAGAAGAGLSLQPTEVLERHGLGSETNTVIGNMSAALAAATKTAISSA